MILVKAVEKRKTTDGTLSINLKQIWKLRSIMTEYDNLYGKYILIKFLGKRNGKHYVGLVVNDEEIKYLRK